MYNYNELYHHGIKGMKWGVRRYQNADGSLTEKGKKRYRRDYDDIKKEQILAERATTLNRTGNRALDNYNNKYYNQKAQQKLNLLLKRIGDEGVSQLDSDVISEGRKIANDAKKQAELFNKSIDVSIDDNYLFLKNPDKEYEGSYNRYLNDNLVRR